MRISDKILCRCRMGTSNPWEKNASKLPLKRNWPLYSIWNTVSRSELKIYGLPIFGSFHQIKSTSAGLFSEVHSSGDWDFSVLDYSSLFRNNQGTRSCSFLFYSAGNFKQVCIQENHYLILLVLLNQFGSTEMSSSYSIKIWIWLYCVLSTYLQQYRIGLRRQKKKSLSPSTSQHFWWLKKAYFSPPTLFLNMLIFCVSASAFQYPSRNLTFRIERNTAGVSWPMEILLN